MQSTDRLLARRYAKAFDGLSATPAEAAAACEALQAAAAALQAARSYMQDPAVPSADKKELVQTLFGTQPQVAGFIQELLAAKRYHLLEACTAEVQHQLEKRQGIARAQVQTAFALNAAQQKQVEEALGHLGGQTVRAEFTVRPEVLGGLKVRMGDTLIDGTFQRRFEKLQEELSK